MTSRVTYRLEDSIATITMDDGKMNVLSLAMFAELNAALDRAAADRAVVVLTGREGVFSAGFDLRVLGAGGRDASELVRTGFELAERTLSFPAPVVVACTGHAIAMGVFLVLAGTTGWCRRRHRIGANEVAIGITMPFFGIEICRQRLAPAHFHRAVINAEIYAPRRRRGRLLDRVVPASDLQDVARGIAVGLAKLDFDGHAASKLRARDHALRAIRAAIDADDVAFRAAT
jgi:enoyl-CoA hydratase